MTSAVLSDLICKDKPPNNKLKRLKHIENIKENFFLMERENNSLYYNFVISTELPLEFYVK